MLSIETQIMSNVVYRKSLIELCRMLSIETQISIYKVQLIEFSLLRHIFPNANVHFSSAHRGHHVTGQRLNVGVPLDVGAYPSLRTQRWCLPNVGVSLLVFVI